MALQPCGVHFNGSINLSSTSEVFDRIPSHLGTHLRRLPDGETGGRYYFVRWQFGSAFSAAPEVISSRMRNPEEMIKDPPVSPEQILSAKEKLSNMSTHFDDYALESYALFKEQKVAGHIPQHVKFQVCLPGAVNVMVGLVPAYRLPIEPLYEAALIRALHRIQSNIPHSELAIQIDVAVEIGLLEGAPPFTAYFEPIFPGVIERLSRFANEVAQNVELGFHLCYGDIEHRHFVEPKDLGLLVEVANALHENVKHPIQWLHVPVPKGRKDVEYLAPLKKLEWEVPELYLGVVHANDEQGTRERIATAKEVVKDFGIATECGLGRTPNEDLGSILEILKNASAPVERT